MWGKTCVTVQGRVFSTSKRVSVGKVTDDSKENSAHTFRVNMRIQVFIQRTATTSVALKHRIFLTSVISLVHIPTKPVIFINSIKHACFQDLSVLGLPRVCGLGWLTTAFR